jgi:hypothetical protein
VFCFNKACPERSRMGLFFSQWTKQTGKYKEFFCFKAQLRSGKKFNYRPVEV